MTAASPVSIDYLLKLFSEEEQVEREMIKVVLAQLSDECEARALELKQVASGYRYQAKQALSPWLTRVADERPARYSRALLETLALVVYRQPVTRAEIEDVRGVAVSSSIIKTLLEREWVRVVGHRDVPGKPALYGTTRQFLDYFNLKGLSELPPLAEIRSLDSIQSELELTLVRNAGEEAANAALMDSELIVTAADDSDEIVTVSPEVSRKDDQMAGSEGGSHGGESDLSDSDMLDNEAPELSTDEAEEVVLERVSAEQAEDDPLAANAKVG